YPGYQAYVRNVYLARESGATDGQKLGAAITRDLMVTASYYGGGDLGGPPWLCCGGPLAAPGPFEPLRPPPPVRTVGPAHLRGPAMRRASAERRELGPAPAWHTRRVGREWARPGRRRRSVAERRRCRALPCGAGPSSGENAGRSRSSWPL